MFKINEDFSIYATRGDIVFFSVSAEDEGVPHIFKAGDVVRIKIYGKKNAAEIALQKDFPVLKDTESVEIYLTREDTKIGEVISKPKDYWYEVVVNDDTKPQTIIGYDEDGARVFKLFPEGKDLTAYIPDAEDIPFVDTELDLTSPRPVQNQAIARVLVSLQAEFDDTKKEVTEKSNNTEQAVADTNKAVAVERARIDNLVSGATADDSEIIDIRVGADGNVYGSAGDAVRKQYNKNAARIDDLTTPSINLFDKRFATPGKFLEYTNTGNAYDIEGFFVSDYIPVKPNTKYNINYTDSEKMISQYDAALNHISSVGDWSITTAENARYIRFSMGIKDIDTTMFVEGELPSAYLPYSEKISYDIFSLNGLNGDAIKHGTINPAKLRGYRVISKNIFNKRAVTEGLYLYYENGDLKEFDGYFVSEFIAVKPNTVYSVSSAEQIAFYDESYKFIEKRSAVQGAFSVPESAVFIRVSNSTARLNTTQINEGTTLCEYDEFAFTIDGNTNNSNSTVQSRICTLGKAWNEWANNKKFPIGILGDSTTDGASTTGWRTETGHEYLDNQGGGFGSVDYINKNAYPYKLEQLIRAELKNDKMRVYNIGYSGFCFYTIMKHYDAIFSGVYSDVKMVGINMGINDRITAGTPDKYYADFRTHLVETIEYLYAKGIQPFIITSQATIEPYPHDSLDAFYPLRTSEHINSIANRVKKEVAREYGLELLDMTMFDEFIMTYSDHKITDITTDGLHYKDLGHTLEAEFLFSELSPRTINATHGTILDFSSQRMKSECPANKVTYMSTPVGKMKLSANYEKSDANDIVLQDFIINITEKTSLCLTAYCSEVNSQYVLIDGEKTAITAPTQTVKTLDVGVHRIKAMSGQSQKVNWIGFTLQAE